MSAPRVKVTKIAGNSIGMSKQIDDPFNEYYSCGNILMPEYDVDILVRLTENSDILQRCIEAYKANIVGFGYNLEYNYDYKEEISKKAQADTDWAKYDLFLKYCNFDENFTSVLKKFIDDRERIGYGTLEVIEDETGEISELQHIPAHTVRLCRDSEPIEVEELIIDSNGNERKIKRWRRFKKFIQMVGCKQVYFKEVGDPRTLDMESGEYIKEGQESNKEANAILFDSIYCPYSPYGMPRYMGALVKLMGSRSADELNFNYFDSGRHIPLAIVVENGQLTEDSMEVLKNSTGVEAQHKYVILEAEAFKDGFSMDEKVPSVKIHFEKLAQVMQDDALFLEYLENNRNVIRSSFGLTPIYTGDSKDFNKATAETAKQITEEQVFEPQREDLSDIFNKKIMKSLDIKHVEMRFKSPKITDDTEIAKALTPYIAGGVATPNMLIDSLGKLIGKELEYITEEWGDIPIQIYLNNLNKNSDSNTIPIEKSVDILKELQLQIEGALNE